MTTLVVSILSLLSFDDLRSQQSTTLEVPAGAAYRVVGVSSSSDSPYCISLIEVEQGQASRALSLACYGAGSSTMAFAGSRVRGGGSYQLVVFRPTRDYAPASVVVKTQFIRGNQ